MLIAFLIVIALVATSWWLVHKALAEARSLTLTRRRLACPGLPPAFDGLRVLHVTDLHLDSGHSPAAAVLREADSLEPDLVMVTGDLVSTCCGVDEGEQFLRAFANRWPTYVVLGNSDQRAIRKRELIARWQETGATILVNERVEVKRNGSRIWIAGVDDPHQGRDSLELALRNVPPEDFALLLAHSPDIALRPRVEEADLVLCGHTHGGQVCFPWLGAIYTRTRIARKYASGLHRINGATVLISRGAGSTKLGIRMHCPPEITLLTLVSWQAKQVLPASQQTAAEQTAVYY